MTHALFIIATFARKRQVSRISRIAAAAQRVDVFQRGISRTIELYMQMCVAMDAPANMDQWVTVTDIERVVGGNNAEDEFSSVFPLRAASLR